MKLENDDLWDALKRIKEKAEAALSAGEEGRGSPARAMREIGEIAGTFLAAAIFVGLAWAYMVLTPPQYSGECELARAEMMEAAE